MNPKNIGKSEGKGSQIDLKKIQGDLYEKY